MCISVVFECVIFKRLMQVIEVRRTLYVIKADSRVGIRLPCEHFRGILNKIWMVNIE